VVLLGLAAVLCGSLAPTIARADEAQPVAPVGVSAEELERRAESISRSIMSPFCPGRTVSACPNAGPWRDDIRRWVAEGYDPTEIKRRLAERVPEHNLAGVPKNRLGWVLPVGLGVGALGILIFLLRYLVSPRRSEPAVDEKLVNDDKAAAGVTRAKANANPSTATRANGEDYDARLEQELDTLEQ
jgi:cytochrome c-type biogenesis protein CcmH/NrfF